MDPLSFNLGALNARKQLDEAITLPQRLRTGPAPAPAAPPPVQAHGRMTPGMGFRGSADVPVGRGNLNLNVGLGGPLGPQPGFQGVGARISAPVGGGMLGFGGNLGPTGAPQNIGMTYDAPAVQGGINYNIPRGALQASTRIPFAEGGAVERRGVQSRHPDALAVWDPFVPGHQMRRSFADGVQGFARGGLAVRRKGR